MYGTSLLCHLYSAHTVWLLSYTVSFWATTLQLNLIFVSTDAFRRPHTLNIEAVRTSETLVATSQTCVLRGYVLSVSLYLRVINYMALRPRKE